MLYSLLLMLNLNVLAPVYAVDAPVDKKVDSIASIVMFRGKDVYIYSGGKKTKVEGANVPFSVHSGDEVEVGPESDCEILMYNKDSIYVSPETLFSLSWYRDEMSTVWIRYGALMYRGSNPVSVKANDLSAMTSGGDFVIRYKRKTSESFLFNFGSEIKFKTYTLHTNQYVRAVAFSNQDVHGNINPSTIPKIYKSFKATFRPEGEADTDHSIPGANSEAAKFDPIEKANLDHIKRAIGI